MSEMSYTKGPWEIDDWNGDRLVRSYTNVNKNDELIAEIFGLKKQRLANAKLIAAAPELLEALQILLKEQPKASSISNGEVDPMSYSMAIKIAKQAIAKATGK